MARRRKRWKEEYDELHRTFEKTSLLPRSLPHFGVRDTSGKRILSGSWGIYRSGRHTPIVTSTARRTVVWRVRSRYVMTSRSDLAKGSFQRGATYDAVIRFSTAIREARRITSRTPGGWRSNYSLKAPCLTTTTQKLLSRSGLVAINGGRLIPYRSTVEDCWISS